MKSTKAIFRTGGGSGFLAGVVQNGFWGHRTLFDAASADAMPVEVRKTGSVKQITADGDTVNVSSDRNFGIRFLGIDTPESKLMREDTRRFVSTSDPFFQELLADPFSAELGAIEGLDPDLRDHLAPMAGPDAATRHHALAKEAEAALEGMIQADKDEIGVEEFFLAFAYDAIDGFGRLLAYVHPNQPDADRDERRGNYNARMLATGLAAPYFIFPNVDPFRARGAPVEAAAEARDPETILAKAPSLRAARDFVAQARAAGIGMFAPENAGIFLAFEFRALARRRPPSRWVIDLGCNEARLRPPQRYFEIERLEDRLFVPPEFVPLFAQAGWTLDAPFDML